jgi:hypothetical protein
MIEPLLNCGLGQFHKILVNICVADLLEPGRPGAKGKLRTFSVRTGDASMSGLHMSSPTVFCCHRGEAAVGYPCFAWSEEVEGVFNVFKRRRLIVCRWSKR